MNAASPRAGRRRLALAVGGTMLALPVALASPALAGQPAGGAHNPPGNNGTVKIHDAAGETTHANQPHVSCEFWVDLWGFDTGQRLTLSFAGQAPTGAGKTTSFTLVSGSNPMVSPDDAGGGNDFDGESGFRASTEQLDALGAPTTHGYHVRLTVATGQGGGKKTKVFWLSPCATPPAQSAPAATTPAAETMSTGSTAGSTSTTPSGATTDASGHAADVTSSGVSAAAAGTATTVGPAAASRSATVLGERFAQPMTRGGSSVTHAGMTSDSMSALPFTGAEIGALSAVGLAALGGGALLLVAARRRRSAFQS